MCTAGAGQESSSAVFHQSSAVCQVPHVHHPDGRLLHHEHGHLAQLDVQNAAHASHAQVGPAALRQVPATPASAAATTGSSAISTGNERTPEIKQASSIFSHRIRSPYRQTVQTEFISKMKHVIRYDVIE